MNKVNPKLVVAIIIIAIVFFFFASSIFQVETDEIAVITRFGKYNRSLDPGLNLKIPFGIENAIKVPVTKVLKEEFGFITTKAGVKSDFYRGEEQINEARMLTADLKVIQVEWIVQYRINNPIDFLFKVRSDYLIKKVIFNQNESSLRQEKKIDTLRALSIASMNQIIGDYLFDEIITIAKSEIKNSMQLKLQEMIKKLQMGIEITTVELINVTPPSEVEAAYNEVLQAQQEKDRIVNEAKQEYNKKVIPVEGQKQRIISEAEGYRAERVKIALGEAKYFNSLYEQYIQAPEVTKKRIYLETMSEILPRLNNVYIIDEKQKNLVPLMQMGITKMTGQGE